MNHKRRILDEIEPLASEKRIDSRLHLYALRRNIKDSSQLISSLRTSSCEKSGNRILKRKILHL
jgi:hypothetical protein